MPQVGNDNLWEAREGSPFPTIRTTGISYWCAVGYDGVEDVSPVLPSPQDVHKQGYIGRDGCDAKEPHWVEDNRVKHFQFFTLHHVLVHSVCVCVCVCVCN